MKTYNGGCLCKAQKPKHRVKKWGNKGTQSKQKNKIKLQKKISDIPDRVQINGAMHEQNENFRRNREYLKVPSRSHRAENTFLKFNSR